MHVRALNFYSPGTNSKLNPRILNLMASNIFFQSFTITLFLLGGSMATDKYTNTLSPAKSIKEFLSLHSSAAHTIIQMFYVQHKQKEISGTALWELIRQFNLTKAASAL